MSGRKAVAVKAARPARKPARRGKSAPPDAQPMASRNSRKDTPTS
jgi:hypothetical protein